MTSSVLQLGHLLPFLREVLGSKTSDFICQTLTLSDFSSFLLISLSISSLSSVGVSKLVLWKGPPSVSCQYIKMRQASQLQHWYFTC